MIRVAVVSRKELGLNCWNSLRFVFRCRDCHRFEKCEYPEKNKEPEELFTTA